MVGELSGSSQSALERQSSAHVAWFYVLKSAKEKKVDEPQSFGRTTARNRRIKNPS